jgi:hypothetical protein
VREFEDCVIIDSEVECKFCAEMFSTKEIKRGINRIERKQNSLKDSFEIPIYLKIFETNIELNVIENTSAVDLYNIAGAWMNIDPN